MWAFSYKNCNFLNQHFTFLPKLELKQYQNNLNLALKDKFTPENESQKISSRQKCAVSTLTEILNDSSQLVHVSKRLGIPEGFGEALFTPFLSSKSLFQLLS